MTSGLSGLVHIECPSKSCESLLVEPDRDEMKKNKNTTTEINEIRL